VVLARNQATRPAGATRAGQLGQKDVGLESIIDISRRSQGFGDKNEGECRRKYPRNAATDPPRPKGTIGTLLNG